MPDQKDEFLTYPEIMYNDCNLDRWLKDESLVPKFNVETGNRNGNCSNNVLLTGSAGFLGRHILLCLLQDEECGKVFCHLRRKSEGRVMLHVKSTSCESVHEHYKVVFGGWEPTQHYRCMVLLLCLVTHAWAIGHHNT